MSAGRRRRNGSDAAGRGGGNPLELPHGAAGQGMLLSRGGYEEAEGAGAAERRGHELDVGI